MSKAKYQAEITALLTTLAAGARPFDLQYVAADLLNRAPKTAVRALQAVPTVDTSALSDAELFAYFKRNALAEDLRFFLRGSLSAELRTRAEAITKPTAKDLASLRTAWRTERQDYERAYGIPAIGSESWKRAYKNDHNTIEDGQRIAVLA